MVSTTLKIVNEQGMHMRPASLMSQEMTKYTCDVKIKFNGNEYDVKSVMSLMTACLKFDSEFELYCDGPDEEEALAKATELVNSGIGD